MRLRNLLRNLFRDWSRNYAQDWNQVFSGVSPNASDVPWSLYVGSQVPLIPRPHDFQNSLGPDEFHTMRALDRVAPSDVRVVILGQDPYPRRRQATGRAFEQGDFVSWDGSVAYGLKHIIQRLAQQRSGDNKYIRRDSAWRFVRDDVSALGLASVQELYDSWEDQGVIFLNYVLTYTLPSHVFSGHSRFWKPVVTAILRHLATRQAHNVVFALWGTRPGRFFSSARILDDAWAAGTYGNIRVLRYNHPSARPRGGGWPPFLRGGNPFREINRQLQFLGEQQINW